MATKRKPARSASTLKPTTPKLAKGEIYAGITLHDNRLHHLIILPGDGEHDWTGAKKYAAKVGGVLPSRHDGLVLLKNARKHFEKTWYWLDEQHAGAAQYAWSQHFASGDQNFLHQGLRLRVRAVRRVAI